MVLFCIGIMIAIIGAILMGISAGVIIKKKSWRFPSAIPTPWESLFKNSTLWQSLLVAVALLAVGAGQLSSEENLNLTKKQTSLELRPFVTIVKPKARFSIDGEGRGWILTKYLIKNVGLQPAHECQIRNDELIEIFLPEGLMKKLKDPGQRTNTWNLYEERKDIMSELSQYLQKKPMASIEEMDKKIEEINKEFKECNFKVGQFPDRGKDFPLPTVISPRDSKPDGYQRSGAKSFILKINNLSDDEKRHMILLHYLHFTYEGSIEKKVYTTSCLYYLNTFELQPPDENGFYPLTEYRQWMNRDSFDN